MQPEASSRRAVDCPCHATSAACPECDVCVLRKPALAFKIFALETVTSDHIDRDQHL